MKRRAAAAGLAGLLAGCVEGLFFHPDQRAYATPAELGVAVREVTFGEPGSRLHGWWMPAAGPARATLVQAHGNAANVSNHAPLVAWLPAAGIHVLGFDYRGFGRSEGRPSLDGVVADTRAAIAQARVLQGAPLPLVVLGQSLGGATALRAVAEERTGDIRLVIVDSAFASYRGIARDAAGSGPLGWVAPVAVSGLPPAEHDPVAAISRLHMPVLLLHGDADSVVPIAHGERLHAAATAPKQFVRIPGGRHLDALTRPAVRAQVLAALQTHLA